MTPATDVLPPLIGQSPPFLALLEQVSRVAPLDRPTLIVGERGTGKELVAARLHYLSDRWEQPLVTLNCAALPETLIETELFGHEAGAFTGAVRRRAGRFERADGGTLFLDEIANAPLGVQEKILRVVEYGEFERVGSSTTIRCDVRLVAAANVDLPAEAAAGRFRHDLLDRLAFEVLTVPPLRARTRDISILAEHFGRRMAVDLGWEEFPGFAGEAMAELLGHPWAGNIRELRNVVERAVYRWPDPTEPIASVSFDPFRSPYRLAGRLEIDQQPARTDHPANGASGGADFETTDLVTAVARFEAELLQQALERTRYNQREAAQSLGLGYHQFRNRLRKHGIPAKTADNG
jgi:psp operon transcriptional activator